MKKKPTCKSCASFKDAVCLGKPETCKDYKFKGNRHKGDNKKDFTVDVCVDDSCKYWDKNSSGCCKKGKFDVNADQDCKFWDMKLSAQLDLTEQETDKLIAKAKESRMPGNQLKIESSDQSKKRKQYAKGGVMIGKGKEKIISLGQTPKADKIIAEVNANLSEMKTPVQGIRAIDLLEVFHAAKTSSAIETIIDLCKKNDIEIIIRPARKQ